MALTGICAMHSSVHDDPTPGPRWIVQSVRAKGGGFRTCPTKSRGSPATAAWSLI